jgi:hypothetical protein
MSRILSRSLFLTFVVCIVAFAAPAFAGQTPADTPQAPTVAQAATPQAAGCGSIGDLLAPEATAPVCTADARADLQPPVFMAKFHGYCRCSCSFTKNCSTSADCGGSPCLGGVTCC